VSLRDRGLEPYRGPRTATRARWLVIARASIGALRRRRGVWAILVVLAVMLSWPVIKLIGGGSLQVTGRGPGGASPIAMDPPLLIFADFTSIGALLLAFAMAQLAAATSVCDDALAFPFYFARPVTRATYLAGKLAGAAAVVGLAVLGPELVLWTVNAGVRGLGHDEVLLLGRVLALGLVETAVLVAPLVALSASFPRRTTAQAAAAALFFLPWIAGYKFAPIARTPWPQILSVPALLDSTGAALFGVTPYGDHPLPPLVAAAAIAAIVGVSLWWSDRRVDAIARRPA
jgi:hypothetical protein